MSVSVCLSQCMSVRDHIFRTTRPIFTEFFVHVTFWRGSVIFWRRSDKLCTSGLMDDVMFAHKPRSLDVAAQLKRSAHSLGLGYKLCAVIPVASQRPHGTTFWALKVTSPVATPGAESAVYDCLAFIFSYWFSLHPAHRFMDTRLKSDRFETIQTDRNARLLRYA